MIDQACALFSPSNPGYRHAGKAVLMILLPYFETIAQFRSGRGSNRQSRKFFKQEFLRVFPLVHTESPSRPLTVQTKDDIADAIYTQVRCGLLHSSAVKSKVALSNRWPDPVRVFMDPTSMEVRVIEIHPEEFLQNVQIGLFPAYLAELRDPMNTDIREKFEQYFDSRGWQ
jgi:hypothetical protein